MLSPRRGLAIPLSPSRLAGHPRAEQGRRDRGTGCKARGREGRRAGAVGREARRAHTGKDISSRQSFAVAKSSQESRTNRRSKRASTALRTQKPRF